MSKGQFRKQLRKKSNYSKDSPMNLESILIESGLYDLNNYKYISKDFESIKMLNLTNNKTFYLRY